MSAFRDAVADDISRVFINPAEFGELHDINGQMVEAVIDRDVLKERPHARTDSIEGVFHDEVLIYVAADSLRRKPVIGEILRLDGGLFLVVESGENMGVLEIMARSNEA